MKRLIIGLSIFLGVSISGFAQSANHDQYKETISYLQGNSIYDRGVMTFFEEMRDYSFAHSDPFMRDAQTLACIFMLIFFSLKCYEMMAGDKKLEIMPLLRPFALVILLMWWPIFCQIIAFPTDLIAAKTEALFGTQNDTNNALRLDRAAYMIEMADQLVEYQAMTEMASEQAQESDKDLGTVIVDGVKGFFSDQILAPIVQMRIRMQTSLQLLATQIIELVAIWILRVCVYIIFMLQIIYSTVLVILGPFSVVVSILPAFRDAFTTWIARFVSVNLYVGVAYLILYITGRLQQYALEVEIDKYEYLLSTGGGADRLEKMAWLASNGFLSFGLVIVAFFVSAIAITTVPSISTWIISTSGISSAATTAGRMGSSASKSISRAKLI
jgi:hypothetical protein